MKDLINPAIFTYTIYVKFANWRILLPLLLIMFMPSFLLGLMMSFPHMEITANSQKQIAQILNMYFASPMVCIATAYFFISDGFAGQKLISEADPLALLFTRPITRFSYVISKFCAALTGGTLIFGCGLLIVYTLAFCLGLKNLPLDYLALPNLVCNMAAWTSLIVFMHSAHPFIALTGYFVLLGTSGMGSLFISTEHSDNSWLELFRDICLFIHNWFGDFLPSQIDLSSLMAAEAFDQYEFAVFLSNIVFFLLLATLALNKRELFYGSE